MYIQPAHILLVDDEEGFRYAAAKTLIGAGYTVAVAEDYRDALNRLDGPNPVDLLITDIVMPNRVNGFALARMAKMRRADIRVLYLTAYDVPTNEASGKVLRKPIAEDDLIEEVRIALA
ncbi:MAG: response regulator [Alphaproteobacteria bacterium]|nr:response regulator [Alphaproteobacteria bacterium]